MCANIGMIQCVCSTQSNICVREPYAAFIRYFYTHKANHCQKWQIEYMWLKQVSLPLVCARVWVIFYSLLNRIEWNNKQNNWIFSSPANAMYNLWLPYVAYTNNWCCVHIHNRRQHRHRIVLFSFVCIGQKHGRPVNALMCEKRVRYSVAIWPRTDCTSRFLMLAVSVWLVKKIVHI